LLNIDNKISSLPIWQVNPTVTVHLRNSNKQHLILAKFYINMHHLLAMKVPSFS